VLLGAASPRDATKCCAMTRRAEGRSPRILTRRLPANEEPYTVAAVFASIGMNWAVRGNNTQRSRRSAVVPNTPKSQLARSDRICKAHVQAPHQLYGIINRIPECIFPCGRRLDPGPPIAEPRTCRRQDRSISFGPRPSRRQDIIFALCSPTTFNRSWLWRSMIVCQNPGALNRRCSSFGRQRVPWPIY
jgi:hypothetical protein